MTFDPSAAALPGSGIFGLPHSREEAALVLVPVPFEATTSYGGGTARAPQAVLSASHQVDLFDAETGRPYEAGMHLLPQSEEIERLDRAARAAAAPVIAVGGAGDDPALKRATAEVNEACERMNAWVEEQVNGLLDQGKVVGLLGGDHSTALGSLAAHARRYPGMGVLHVDAHADLRVAYEGFTCSHASVIYNAAERLPEIARIVQVGLRDLSAEERAYATGSHGRIDQHLDGELTRARFEGEPWGAQVRRIIDPLPSDVYVTFDIDGLDPSLCPHTGTPVPGGLGFAEACHLLAAVVRSGRRIVGFDLVEVAPDPAGGEWDGNVGARLLYKLAGWTLLGRPGVRR